MPKKKKSERPKKKLAASTIVPKQTLWEWDILQIEFQSRPNITIKAFAEEKDIPLSTAYAKLRLEPRRRTQQRIAEKTKQHLERRAAKSNADLIEKILDITVDTVDRCLLRIRKGEKIEKQCSCGRVVTIELEGLTVATAMGRLTDLLKLQVSILKDFGDNDSANDIDKYLADLERQELADS